MEKEQKNIRDQALEIIEGEFVTISQSTVRNVEGGHIEMQQVCALSIDGERVETTQAAAAVVRGNHLDMHQSISLATVSSDTSINYSFSPVSVSRGDTRIDRSAVGVVAAGTVKAENTAALLVLSSEVDGNLTTLLDWKSTVALGAVIGGVWGLLSLFRRR